MFVVWIRDAMPSAGNCQYARPVVVVVVVVVLKSTPSTIHQIIQVQKDLLGMRFLAELLGAVFPEYQYTWLFPDFEESIGLELGKKEMQRACMRDDCCCSSHAYLYPTFVMRFGMPPLGCQYSDDPG